jgi:phage terminase large subunit
VVEAPWICPTTACKERIATKSVVLTQKGKPPRPLFVPLPKQCEWMERALDQRITRLLVGGAAGPGKSRFMREFLYRLAQTIPGFHGLLLRRTHKDLEQSHGRWIPFEVSLRGGTWKVADRIVEFAHKGQPPGIIRLGHLEDSGSLQNYLSAEYDVICPDELVTFERDAMIELFTRARSTSPHLLALRGGYAYDALNEDGVMERMVTDGSLVLASSNPAGRGSLWIRDFFIEKCPDPDVYPSYRPEFWHFEGAKLKENPYISRGYVQTLRDLPEMRRRQLLDGDWNVFDGQFFSFRESQHVQDLGLTA